MKYQRSNDQTLKEVIEQVIDQYRLGDRISQRKAVAAWTSVVGPLISKHTLKIFLKNRKLFVKLDSSEVRNELLYSHSLLIRSLNKEAGAEVIDDIVLS